MIDANEKRYESFNSIRRTIDAALFLGIPEDTIKDVFKRRGMKKLFNKIKLKSKKAIDIIKELANLIT